jgi:formylglycine-generating enzyme required for sulfatase activity
LRSASAQAGEKTKKAFLIWLRGNEAAANDEPAVHVDPGLMPLGAIGNAERRTRGGSCWCGAAQMRVDHLQGKSGETTPVYIGFRCVRQP